MKRADPAKIPWKVGGTDIIIESSGAFRRRSKADRLEFQIGTTTKGDIPPAAGTLPDSSPTGGSDFPSAEFGGGRGAPTARKKDPREEPFRVPYIGRGEP